MISFELNNDEKSIQIYCDPEGLEDFISRLKKLKENKIDHTHWCAPSCGGNILNDQNPWGEPAIGEVIIDVNF